MLQVLEQKRLRLRQVRGLRRLWKRRLQSLRMDAREAMGRSPDQPGERPVAPPAQRPPKRWNGQRVRSWTRRRRDDDRKERRDATRESRGSFFCAVVPRTFTELARRVGILSGSSELSNRHSVSWDRAPRLCAPQRLRRLAPERRGGDSCIAGGVRLTSFRFLRGRNGFDGGSEVEVACNGFSGARQCPGSAIYTQTIPTHWLPEGSHV